MRRAAKLAVAVLTVAGVLFLFGFPVRTLLQQRHQMSVTERRSAEIGAENAKLQKTAALLQTNSEIEKLARSKYGLVKPGEHAYVVVPPTASAPTP